MIGVAKLVFAVTLELFTLIRKNARAVPPAPKSAQLMPLLETPRSPYFIVEDKCTGCGSCMEVCKFASVFFR